MLIGVISDTHIPQSADEIPQSVFSIFKGVDLIIHAGDLTS
ncbi:MAG: metallophosphoesterase family protein, partial [Candidatus Omnitrophota bacterium]